MLNTREDYQKRLQQIIGAMPCGYLYGEVVVDGDGVPINYSVIDANDILLDFASTNKKKLKGKRIAGLFSLSSVKDDISLFSKVSLTGDPIDRRFYSPKLDKHFSLFCFSPKLGYFIALLVDISAEKKFEYGLSFIRSFGNSTSDEFFILDSNARFVAGNSSVADRLGISEGKLRGLHFSALNSLATDGWWATLWETLLEKHSIQFETDHRGSDNIPYPVELSIDLMNFGNTQYATMVAKNISNKRALTTALKQDRKFAEKAASIAGYFIWMLDTEGIFRPLLGTDSGFNSGAVEDVFLSQIHPEDRKSFADSLKTNKEGFEEFRLRTDRGYVYHNSKWSTSEEDVIIGICYPLTGGGLAGLGSESVAMKAINLLIESLKHKFNQLHIYLIKNELGKAERIIQSLITDFTMLSVEKVNAEIVNFDKFLVENEPIFVNLLQPSLSLTIDSSIKAFAFVDLSALENIIIRLVLITKNTNRATDIFLSSYKDSINCGIKIKVVGLEGIQAELEKLFIPIKGSTPSLASVYSMVKNTGGEICYDTFDQTVEFTISYSQENIDNEVYQVLVSLPDCADSAKVFGTLKSEGYSVKAENRFSEIIKCINEQSIELFITSDSFIEFSILDILSATTNSHLKLLLFAEEPPTFQAEYLHNNFQNKELISKVRKLI